MEGLTVLSEEIWATASMREFIFWRDGMTPEEFEEEQQYYYAHTEDLKKGTYTPLWKQRSER